MTASETAILISRRSVNDDLFSILYDEFVFKNAGFCIKVDEFFIKMMNFICIKVMNFVCSRLKIWVSQASWSS